MAVWVDDNDFVGGTNQQAPTIKPPAVNAAPIEVLRTVRVGAAGFITLRPARKELVRITFADVTSTAAGQNKQSVSINGSLYVSDLDVFALTGSVSTVVRDVVVQQPAGNVVMGFSASVGQTQIAALEFLDAGNLPLSTPVSGPISFEIPTDGVKWLREVWANPNFTGPPLFTEIIAGPNIDYDFASSEPAPGIGADNWAQRFSRNATLTADDYIGYARAADDGVRVKIDGQLVQAKVAGTSTNVESWVQQAPTDYDFPFTVASTHQVLEVVEHNDWVFTASVHYSRAVLSDPPPPPPPPPPPGSVLLGSFNTNSQGRGDWESLLETPAWDFMVNKASTMAMTYMASNDMASLGHNMDYLDAHPGLQLKQSINFLGGEPGNFGSSTARSQATAIAQAIQARGLGPRIVIRHMYEFNADYGFEWMPRNHGGNFAAATDMYRDIVDLMRAACPSLTFVWCVVPWDANAQSELEPCWPGGAWVDYVGLDVYNAWTSGNEAQRWAVVNNRCDVGINFARSKGKPWSFDECSNVATWTAMGGGDDATFVIGIYEKARLAGDCHSVSWFNSPAGGVEWVIGPDTPNSRNAIRAEMALFS